jgi:ABC-type multidrug transport system fused ATPase/permease subunit
MNFILTTLSITLGVILAWILITMLAVISFTSQKVLKLYSKLSMKMVNTMNELIDEIEENQ